MNKTKNLDNPLKTWYEIEVGLAIKNIKEGYPIKCYLNKIEYLFNIVHQSNSDITPDMINKGKWYVYTWAD